MKIEYFFQSHNTIQSSMQHGLRKLFFFFVLWPLWSVFVVTDEVKCYKRTKVPPIWSIITTVWDHHPAVPCLIGILGRHKNELGEKKSVRTTCYPNREFHWIDFQYAPGSQSLGDWNTAANNDILRTQNKYICVRCAPVYVIYTHI